VSGVGAKQDSVGRGNVDREKGATKGRGGGTISFATFNWIQNETDLIKQSVTPGEGISNGVFNRTPAVGAEECSAST